MQCPTCDHVDLAMTDRQGIEIDHCPQCRGIWLDRGERDRLIGRAEQATAPLLPGAPPRYRDQPSRDHHARHAGDRRHDDTQSLHEKRPKLRLGELFDS